MHAGEAVVQIAEDVVDRTPAAIKFYATNATFRAENNWLRNISLGSTAAMSMDCASSVAASEMGGADSLLAMPHQPEMSQRFSNLPAQHWLRLKGARGAGAASVASSTCQRPALLKMLPKVCDNYLAF